MLRTCTSVVRCELGVRFALAQSNAAVVLMGPESVSVASVGCVWSLGETQMGVFDKKNSTPRDLTRTE